MNFSGKILATKELMKKIPANLHVAKISPLICRWNAKNVASEATYVVIGYSPLPSLLPGHSILCNT